MHSVELMLEILIATIQENLVLLIGMVGALWILQIFNAISGYRLNYFGLLPRTGRGIVGIFISPFLHGSFNHLFFNTIPLLVFACFILVGGQILFFKVSVTIILLSGLLVWFFGRRAIHVGASGLIMGYWGYLLMNAYHQPSLMTIVLAIVSLYYFGGLFFGIFPTREAVSWEGHLFGCVAGIAADFLYPLST